mgnify:CR=1 FL=1
MKKFLIFLSILAISGVNFIIPLTKATAAPEVDQQYTAGTGSLSIDSYLGRFVQTFMPTKTKLDKVQIELANVVGNKSVTVSIRHNVVGVGWDAGSVATVPDQTVTNGWNTFDFADVTTTISATETYGIWVVSNADGPMWKYTSGPSTYDRGYAIWQSQDKVDWDWNFKTFGYDPASDTPAPAGDETAITGTTEAGETLGTTTTAIAKPSDLKADYSDTAGSRGIKLTWKATTTTDIDGYKVFRSEKSASGYAKLADSKKDKVEYLDQDVAAGKTYYYQVRAYKGNGQSVSSNTASAAVPADAPPAKPSGLTVVATTTTTLSLKWKANSEANIASYNLTLYKGEEKIKTAEVKKDLTTYEFNGLTENTVYKITLTATNDKGKISDPDSTSGATAAVETKFSWFNSLTISGALLVLVLAGLLIYRIKKRSKQNNV